MKSETKKIYQQTNLDKTKKISISYTIWTYKNVFTVKLVQIYVFY